MYIDETLYDVTHDATVRDMCLNLDRTRHHRIELLAVPIDDPEAIWWPQPGLLKGWQPKVNSTAKIELIRDEDLPVDTQLVISLDGKDVEHGPMWPPTEARAGSLSEQGVTFDGAFGLGLGVGDLGAGPLGFDGTAWHWLRNDLDTGYHDVRITSVDQSGIPVSVPLDVSLLIEQLPSPVTGLSILAPLGITWETVDETP